MSSESTPVEGPASAVTGTWDLVIRTPLGRLPVVLTLHTLAPDAWTGTAEGAGDTVPLIDITVRADDAPGAYLIAWTQTINRPLRLRLDFNVLIAADTLTGSSRAGKLPRSTVTGTRR